MEQVGGLHLTDEQKTILLAPAEDGDLHINPQGQVYVSHVTYRARLVKAFGPGGWGIKPVGEVVLTKAKCSKEGEPKCEVMHTVGLSREYGLWLNNVFVSSASGYSAYDEDGINSRRNAMVGYADALESARSNALTRCCKDLGMFSECWDKDWCDDWKRKNAVKGQYGWEKKKQGPAKPTARPEGDARAKAETLAGPADIGKTIPTGQTPTRASLLARANKLISDGKATPKTFRDLSGGKAAIDLSDPELASVLDKIEVRA